MTAAALPHAPGQSRAVPRLLIALAFALTAIFVVAPLACIFWRAFAEGWAVYIGNILDPMTLHAIWLTSLVAVIVVPVNIAFGIAAAWAIARFRFPGRSLLMTAIEIPFSISPIMPESSIPVAPLPITTKVSHSLRSSGSGSRSAISKAEKIRWRIRPVSSMVLSPGAASAHSGWPK